MKKRISFVLALLLLLSSMAACSDAPATETETENTGAADPSDTAEAETESLTPHWDAVAKPKLNGVTINAECVEYDPNFYNVLDWEEITGDNLNDAVYDRNRYIESQLDCLFVNHYGYPPDTLKQAVTSGDGSVDMAYCLLNVSGSLLQQGYLKSYNSLEAIDLTKPYWDQGSIRDLTVLDQYFFGYPDFGFDHYDSMAVMFYNGAIIEEKQMEDPYELFKNDQWTIAKFWEQIQQASEDVNGDGLMKLDTDKYGLMGREYYYQPMMFSSGVSIIGWDAANEQFTFNLNNERFLKVAEAIGGIYQTSNSDYVDYSNYDAGRNAFSEGRSLFYSRLLGDFKQLREVEDDYGLICFPRLDYETNESSYYVQNPTTLYIPIDVGDDNKDGKDDYYEIGVFLEAISAYTYDVTLDEYLNRAVIGKGMRDQNSVDMVRTMVQSRSFDLGYAYGFTNIHSSLSACIQVNAKYASVAKKMEKPFTNTSKKMLDEIRSHIEMEAANAD